ncbi:cell wall-binding repeat-containing protein [Planococcus sp. A6]|uniref:cell wall-binding repeat-containing protein n=1 Tax=Planococcus sp. A6 TaxID=2992760 RepID=UPI00237B7613|nr:cell wall-binding repeat-containing protein [Planococcus sp. A6]
MQNGSKTWKKFVSVAMIAGLVASNGVMTASATSGEKEKASEQDLQAINVLSNEKAELIKQLKKQESPDMVQKDALDPNEEVRVIIEIEGQSAVEVASAKGVQYKTLAKAEKEQIETQLVKTHSSVKKSISSEGVELNSQYEYTTAFNGFSGVVKFSDVEKIKDLPNVKNVYIANEYERPEAKPDMTTSHDFIQSRQVWADSKFQGEGMVVAVIDTGIDPEHKDFNITDDSKVDLTKSDVEGLISKDGLKGAYQNVKVPYAYNYYDKNAEIQDDGPGASMHGMHVAGTVGANGDESEGGLKGVAPESQILGMKVFSNDVNFPSTFSDIYLAAIDDAVKLGADVLNMSLGSTSSFYDADSAEDKAITNAVNNGIVSAVSAGNSGHIGYGYDNPHYDNPDYGLVGSPGLNKDTIQVAATGNVVNHYTHDVEFDDLTVEGFGVDDWTDFETKGDDFEVVSLKELTGDDTALGAEADYEDIDVEGKVVVVERGAHTFVDKTNWAAAAGAIGIIVYNSTSPIFYKDQGGWDIPFMKITREDGLALEEALAADGELGADVEQTGKELGPEVGRATDFTSWGVTPDLEFKPELSAPGGNILSTLENDKYGVMSGTSMAAPHVAGGAALVQQYLKNHDEFKNLSLEERTRLAKVLLLNTADITHGKSGDTISPRRQGAGMMQLNGAVTTPVIMTEKATNEAKVNVKDFTGDSFSFTLKAENLSNEAATYSVDTSVLVDMFQENGTVTSNLLQSGALEGAKVTAPETVTVPANGTVDVKVTVDISEGKVPGLDKDGNAITKALEEDVFVEGFVKLTAEEGSSNPDLVLPYISFYGEWDRPDIIDSFGVEEKDEPHFYQAYYDAFGVKDADDTTVDEEDEKHYYDLVEVDGEWVYPVSPNGDGLNDKINGNITLLRNADELQTNILNAEGEKVRTVNIEKDVRKNFFNGGSGTFLSYVQARAWDGKVKGEVAADGLYEYEYKAKVDYEEADWQSKSLPVYIDTTAPEASVTVNEEDNTLEVSLSDEGVGVKQFSINVDGKRLPAEKGYFDADETVVDLDEFGLDASEADLIEIVALDHAFNGSYAISNADDTVKPVIYVADDGPEPLKIYGTNTVPVKGYVVEENLKTLKVNGKEVDFTETDKGFAFDTTIELETGRQEVKFEATDYNGNTSSIIRPIFVDTVNPTLAIDAPGVVDEDEESVEFDITVKDNFNMVKLSLDGDVLYNQDVYDELKVADPISKTVTAKVDLAPGVNTFMVVAEDAAGNKIEKEVKIDRSDSELRAERISGVSRYDTAVELSKEGWDSSETVVLARGDNYADALAGVPLAKKQDAPLLLTRTAKLPSETYDEIKRLGAKKVQVLGGTIAISDDVVKQLKSDGIEVERISGASRYETAAKIAEKFGKSESAIVVSGENFPDALSVASYAGSEGTPILLAREGSIPNATKAALVKMGAESSLIIGGTQAISEQAASELPNSFRIKGSNRYETSLEVAKYFGSPTDTVYIATGTAFADALAGGALAAKNDTGVYLVGKSVPAELGEHLQKNGVEYAKVIGGSQAVSDEILKQLDEYLNNK